MKEKKFRTFIINGKEMIFNLDSFRKLFLKYASQRNIGIGGYEYEVADALFVDKSAVHNWRMGVNGPGDIEKIQLLSKLWNINYEILLMEEKTMTTTNENKKLTDRERVALKNVYSSFLNYMNLFQDSSGFIWNDDNSRFNIMQAYAQFEQVKYTLELEYIDLKGNVYDELKEFYEKELTSTLEADYNGENGDYPEIQYAMTVDIYNELVSTFKNIITPYL